MALVSLLHSLPPLRGTHSRLYLCRHGETESNAQSLLQGSGVDARLNPTGKAQAAKLAGALSSVTLDLVASSTLARAQETADIVASSQQPAAERQSNAELAEMFYGSLEGLPIKSCRAEITALTEHWTAGRTNVAVGGDGESPDMLLERAQKALWGGGLLGSRAAGRHVVVVAHSSFNKVLPPTNPAPHCTESSGYARRRRGEFFHFSLA